MIKSWETILLGSMSKIEQIHFLTHKCICGSLNTINVKLSCNHGGIYRFRRKFKKDSKEVKPLGVHRKMIIGNWQYMCLLFCWFWPKYYDNVQKREDSRKWGDWFWSDEYRHLCTVVLVHKVIPVAPFGGQNIIWILVTSGCLLSRKVWWTVRVSSFCSELKYFTDQNRPKLGPQENEFWPFSNIKVNITNRAEKVVQKMGSFV